MISKKLQERRVIEAVRNLWAGFPNGEILNCESPDFVVTSPEESVFGFEVLTYFRPGTQAKGIPKEQESLRWRIARKVVEELEELSGTPLDVALHFSQRHRISKNSVSQLTRAIVDIVLPHSAKLELDSHTRVDRSNESLPDQLRSIRISRLSVLTKTSCSPPGATFIPTLNPTEVQKMIDKKNAKLPLYLSRCDDAALVIEIHGFQLSSVAELDDSIFSHRFRSGFSNVFILWDGDRLIELKQS